MGPMNKATLLVPDVFAVKADRFAVLEIVDTRRKVNVVLDEDRLARLEFQDEALMRRTRRVIAKNALDGALPRDLDVTLMLLECAFDGTARGRLSRSTCGREPNDGQKQKRKLGPEHLWVQVHARIYYSLC